MRTILQTTIFILLFSSPSWNQVTTVITGKVTNEQGEPIEDVYIYVSNNPKSTTRSNSEGMYSLKVEMNTKTQLIFRHVGYRTTRIYLSKQDFDKDQIVQNISLQVNTLKEKVIYAKEKPETVFGSETTSIADYEFVENHLVVLAYDKSLKKDGYLQLASKNNELISETKTPNKPKRLFKDFENRLYLITEYSVYTISIFQNEFRLRPVNKDDFYKFTARIIDTTAHHFLYSDYNPNYPAFNYYSQELRDTATKTIHRVKNEFMMDLYRAEYKYAPNKEKLWAYRQELITGIDKEIWIGAANFTQSIYYEPLYAPLFVNKDTTLIFDHYSDYLYKIDQNFNKIDSIPIYYHKQKEKKNWEQPLIKDKEEHKLYVLFLKNGFYYLKPVNLSNGSTYVSFKLANKYVENVKVENGYVYYIYRPYESSQKKYLYREVIRTS